MMKGETVISGAPHPGTPLQVLESTRGFYIGYLDTDGAAYSRESVYFPNKQSAMMVWSTIRGSDEDSEAVRMIRSTTLGLLRDVFTP